ncbi:MAG: 50S ribosomal protein L29 [Candidatus Algichlamydia australiensis]|nr:50S ribosomal protein L29 [Chlamydiales bacterium]
MQKMEELLAQSEEELVLAASDLSRELFKLRTELAEEKKLSQPHLVGAKRRERARVLTALQQKKAARSKS